MKQQCFGAATRVDLWTRTAERRARFRSTLHAVSCLVPLLVGVFQAAGEEPSHPEAATFPDFSLEQLINIEVTSVGKKETLLFKSPAAVAVLTQEDIRRLGVTSIPEALRAIPGMQVARISANRWAVSARGMNDEYSNKLLVLIDGRSVYTPLFGGVHWNVQDVVLEDLERIEVIRGPGATLWGANAVNGVINIITKSARETQGVLVSTSAGTEDRPAVSARYGGAVSSNFHYRVYGKYFNREGFEDAHGRSMSDHWDLGRGGIRMDWDPGEQSAVTLSGEYYKGSFGEDVGKISALPFPDFRNLAVDGGLSGGHVLGRWSHRFSEESELKLQLYYDRYSRDHPFGGGVLMASPNDFNTAQNKINEQRDTWDFDMQHRFRWLERNEIVWGVGVRRTRDQLDPGGTEHVWTREQATDDLFSGFIQDEITLIDERLALTLGTKVEHNDYTGVEFQPAGRVAWTPTDHQTLWGSVARAVRTPTRLERDARIDVGAMPPMAPGQDPALISVFANPDASAEELISYELGYRFEPVRRLSFDLAGFYTDYQLLANMEGERRDEAGGPIPHDVIPYNVENDIHGHTFGFEALVKWQPTDAWRLAAGYTWWGKSFERSPYYDRTNPAHQVHVRSTLQLGHGWELNGAVYFVDRIRGITQGSANARVIDSYVRLDLGVNWKATENLEFSVWGQNLLDEGHPEFSSYKSSRVAEIPRAIVGKVTLQF